MEKTSISIELKDQGVQLRQWAEDNGLTVSAIFEGLWAILLSYHSGSDSANFRISQQSSESISVEDCHVEINENIPFTDFTRSLQKTLVKQSRPLSLVSLPTALPLQETQLYFLQGPVDFSKIDSDNAQVAIVVEQSFSRLLTKFRYTSSALREDEAQSLVESFKTGLDHVLENPRIAIDEIDFVSKDQYTQLMKWNSPYPESHSRNVHELISMRAALQPSAIAICSTEVNLTYRRVEEMTSGFAQILVDAGVGAEVVVPICSQKSPWAVLAMVSVVKAGGAYTIIPPDAPRARVSRILDTVDAKIVLAEPATARKFISTKPIVFDAGIFNSLTKASSTAKFGRVKPTNAFCVIFTSGTSGQPKAITIEHQNHVTSSRATAKYFGWTPKTRIFQHAAYNWDASVRDIFGGLMAGCCVCVPTESERKDALSSTIIRLKANFLSASPHVLNTLSPEDVTSLRTISSIGEKMTDDVAATWSEYARLINEYGPSETTVSSSMRDVDVTQYASANIGSRLPSALHWAANPRNPNILVPIGAVGELIVQGPIVTRGYRNLHDETAAVYVKNLAWQRKFGYPEDKQRSYRTGDMVRVMADGSFELIGRRDTQIKINGERVEISEIEESLMSAAPSFTSLFVSQISPCDRPEDKTLVAFIEKSHLSSTTPATEFGIVAASEETATLASTIQNAVADVLPTFMIPTHYIPITYAPRLASGKLHRSLLHSWASKLTSEDLATYAGTASHKDEVSTTTEISLRAMWASILSIDDIARIGANADFMRLGGNTISAIKLSRTAREQGIILSSSAILECPTLKEMARIAVIDSTQALGTMSIEAPEPFALVDASLMSNEILAAVAKDLRVDVESIQDSYPCTMLQGDLMAATMLDPAAYTSQKVFKLPEDLDLERFQAAWDGIHSLTPMLRTRIHSIVVADRAHLYQVVVDEDIPWQLETDLQEYLDTDKQLGMTVGQKLSRFAIVRSDDSQYFVWTAHQALYDEWSLELLLDDVATLYNGEFPETRPGINTFVRYLTSQDTTKHETFWKTYLEGYKSPDFLQLPSHKTSALATQTAKHTCALASTNTAQVTNSALYRVAWAMVLEQYTGSRDSVFGCVQTGRTVNEVDADQLIAPMFATIPVRVRYHQTQSVESILIQAQREADEMRPYEHVGLQSLRQYNDTCRQASDFQSVLIVHAPSTEKPYPFKSQEKREGEDSLTYALGIECYPQQDQLCVEAHFDPEVVEEETVQRMLHQFESIMAQIAVAGDDSVATLDTLSTFDKECLEMFNDNGVQTINACVHNVIRQRTFLSPDAPALRDDTIELTYKQLDNLSQRFAAHLARSGVGPEVIVPVCTEKSVWAAVSMLSVIRAGGVCVALDPALPDARLADMLERTGAKQMLCSPKNQYRFKASNINVTVIDKQAIEKLPLAPISARSSAKPENAAFVVFTSGSTGKPKGIVLEHRNVCTTAQSMHNVQYLNATARVLQFASWTFDVYIEEIFISLMWGALVCIPTDDQRRNDLPDFINRMEVNWMDVTPTLMGTLNPDDVPTLKTLVCGGEKMPKEVLEKWVDRVNVVYTYGPAECSVICTSMTGPMTRETEISNVGVPMGGSIWITYPDDHNRLVPVGSVGELLVEGPIVAREYLNDPVTTAKSFIVNPTWSIREGESRRFYKTGDLAKFNMDGSICIIGRADSQIKINGQRVELGDIEHAIIQVAPDGTRAVVEAIPDPQNPALKQLAAFIAYATDELPAQGICLDVSDRIRETLSDIQSQMGRLVAPYMVPRLFVPVVILPETPSGKTDRKALRELTSKFTYEQRMQFSLLTGDKRKPATPQEKALRTMWSSILNIDESSIGVDDKFFQLGGNSVAAMHLASAARAAGLTIAVRDVFEHPKLCDLAKKLASSDGKFDKVIPVPAKSAKRGEVAKKADTVKKSEVSKRAGTVKKTEAPKKVQTMQRSQTVKMGPISKKSASSKAPSSSGSSASPSDTDSSPSETPPSSGTSSPVERPSTPDINESPGASEQHKKLVEEIRTQLNCKASAIEDVYLCTPLQQNLMASTIRTPASYVLREAFELTSEIDIDEFKNAWNTVAAQHPILRTRILSVTDCDSIENYQVVLKEKLEWVEANNLSTYLEKDKGRGMEYGKPLCRFAIITESEDTKYFVFTAHHAIYDGWSLSLVYKAVSDAYEGEDLEPSIPYKHFAQYVQDIDPVQSANFWETQLQHCAPTQFPPVVKQGHTTHASEIMVQQFKHQLNFRRSTDVMLSTLLQAAWAILLSKWTDSQDIVFGSINAGRDTPVDGIEMMTGPTVATVPLRIRFEEGENVRHFLKRLQTESLDVAEHQHFGLDRISKVSTEARQATQFQNLFVIQPGDDSASTESELLQLPKVPTEQQGYSSFPLTMQCSLGKTNVSALANYDPAILNSSDVKRILDQFAHITQQLVKAGGGTALAELDLLNLGDIAQLRKWNNYDPETIERSIPEVIADSVKNQPQAEALCGWDGALTYAELDDLSTRLACVLQKTHHVQIGDNIPFCSEKSVWTVVAMVAILKAGGATTALDPSFPTERINAILGATQAQFIITQPKYEEKFDLLGHKVLVIDEAMIKSLPRASSSHLRPVPPTSPACILFTSGTTGTPKGIVLEHQAIATAAREHGRASGVKPGTRVLQFAAYTFDVSIQDTLMTLQNGGCICVPSNAQRLDDIAGAINDMQVNWTFLTPTVAKLLEPASVPTLQSLVLGGEAMPAEQLALWSQHVTLYNGYGPAEAGTVCAVRKTNDSLTYEPANVGRSLKSLRCWVTDAYNPDKLQPIGAMGELIVEGPSLALHYLKDPEKTAAAFIEPPVWAKNGRVTSTHKWRWYRTGDLVRQMADGSFTYLGRRDNQVKLHGQRLELDEIEHHIKTAFDMECQIVVDVVQPTHRQGTDLLTAFVCLSQNNTPTPVRQSLIVDVSSSYIEKAKDVKAKIAKLLPAYAIPVLWIPVTHMPTSLSQKLDRKMLKTVANYLSADELALCSFANSKKRPPVTDVEKALVQLWANLLKLRISSIGLDDSFLEIGGDSITAMKLVTLARKNKLILSMETIFRCPRLEDMAAAATEMEPKPAAKADLPELRPFSLIKMSQKDRIVYLDGLATDYNLVKSDIVDAYPCTPMQEGLFALTMSDSSLYMAQFAFEMAEDTDLELFMNAWDEVVKMLPVLRTVIAPAPPQLQDKCNSVQIVLDKPSPWTRYEGNEVKKFLAAEYPRNIGYGSPLTKLAIIEGDKRYFMLTMHHAFYDGFSLPNIFEMVEREYFESPRARLVPFTHFVRNLIDLPREELAEYWTDYLMGYTSTGFPKLPNPKYVPVIDGQLSKSVSLKGCKIPGVMTATLLQTAWAMILGAHSGTDDVVFLSTQMGRSSDLEGLEEIIGCTITTIPVRFILDRTQKLGDFLRHTQDRSNGLMKYEHFGMRNIQRLGPDQKTACSAGCLMVIQPQAQKGESKLGLTALHDNDTQMLSYPLVVEFNLGEGVVNARFGFDTNLLPTHLMERIIDQFASMVESLSTLTEETPVADIDILSPTELALLKEWNTTPPKYVHETVQEQFRRGVKKWPKRVAIDAHDARITYDELDRMSDNLAQHLLSLDLPRQQIIPIAFEKSAFTVVCMLAVAKAACTFVLFDPSVPMDRCVDIARDTSTRVILASKAQTEKWTQHYIVVTVDEAFLSSLPEARSDIANVPCTPQDLLYLIFTSGSTGKPKGCMTEHGSFLTVLQGQRDACNFNIEDRMLQFASYSFDVSLLEMWTTIMFGARLCVPTSEACKTDVGNVLRTYKVTWSYITPSLARTLDPITLPSLRALALVGEQVMPQDVAKWAPHLSMINGYGPSESVAATSYIGVKVDGEPSNIGLPMGCVCWIVDPEDHDRLVPIGTVGELVIDGPIVSPGYYQNAEKTAECFIPSTKFLEPITGRKTTRMYKTGDLAFQNPDRTITFVGRKDTQVKIRGQRMELGEPEAHLSQESIVHAAVVLKGAKGSPAENQLVTILQLNTEYKSLQRKGTIQYLAASKALSDHTTNLTNTLEKKMPLYMVPTTWIFLEAMPLLPAGKIDRKRLANWLTSMEDEVFQEITGNVTEEVNDSDLTPNLIALRDAVSQALSMPADKVKLNRSFAAQGGDSISAMKVHSVLRKKRINVDVKDISVAASLTELADTLQPLEGAEETIEIPVEVEEQPFALAPMQAWYAKYALGNDELSQTTNANFNFTFNFTFKVPVSNAAIRNALEAVVNRHSMLRARFFVDPNGEWKQIITKDIRGSYQLGTFKAASAFERDVVLEANRTSLDVKNGPLMRADIVSMADGTKSFHVVLHHMCTDRVSWSIILSDIEKHITTGSLPEQAPFSYQVWRELQAKDAVANWPPQKALPYEVPDSNFDFWGMTNAPNTTLQMVTRNMRLPIDLMPRVRARTGMEDLEEFDMLIVALSSAFKQNFQERPAPTIFNQGHGRDAHHPDVDLTQTVGWFTTYYPLQVSPRFDEDPVALLQRTRALRQTLPHGGRDYFASRYHHPEGMQAFSNDDNMEVYLNYLGDLRKHNEDGVYFEMMNGPDGGLHGEKEDYKRLALFTINALTDADGFRIQFTYPKHAKHTHRIENWVRDFEMYLHKLGGATVRQVKRSPTWRNKEPGVEVLVVRDDQPTPLRTGMMGMQMKLGATMGAVRSKSTRVLGRMKSSAVLRGVKVGRSYVV